jgi:hypothetical protein
MQIHAPGRRKSDVEQERRGDIVGKVPYDSEGRGQCREIKAQGVGLMDRQPLGGVAFVQALAQVAVELDDVHVLDAFEKRVGQRPKSGADFDDMLSALRVDCS